MGARIMAFINETGIIGTIIQAGTDNMTGSIVGTLMFILLFLVVVAVFFGIPFEFMAVLLLPFVIGLGAYYSSFMIPIVVTLIIIASIIAKNWLFR